MCCFTESVEDVSNTRIFARQEGATQYLVYEMMFSSREDLAMILPIPVVTGIGDDAVTFISMEDYPKFFNRLDDLFPTVGDFMDDLSLGEPVAAAVLEVHQVGCFDASFVPHQKDFSRLDPRFRLPDGIWKNFAEYADYGFVVFKLTKGRNQEVHPMAFAFPTRMPKTLFFPTVHIHDEAYHDFAEFDHALYAQASRDIPGWKKSEWALGVEPGNDPPDWALAGSLDNALSEWEWFIKKIRPEKWEQAVQMKVVKREEFCYRRKLDGTLKNADTWISLNHSG